MFNGWFLITRARIYMQIYYLFCTYQIIFILIVVRFFILLLLSNYIFLFETNNYKNFLRVKYLFYNLIKIS